jgi:hypothetical protein
VIAKPRDHDTQPFRGFDHLGPGRHLDIPIVDDEFRHLFFNRQLLVVSGALPLRHYWSLSPHTSGNHRYFYFGLTQK